MKKIFGMLVIAVAAGLFMMPQAQAKRGDICVNLIHGDESTEYAFVEQALAQVQKGDTIKFVAPITSNCLQSEEINQSLIINKDVTVDFNGQYIDVPILVSAKQNVTFIGDTNEKYGSSKPLFTISDGATVVFDGGNYKKSYAPAMFEVGANANLTVQNATIRSGNVAFDLKGGNATVKVINSSVDAKNGFLVNSNQNTITVQGGTLHHGTAIVNFATSANNNTVDLTGIEKLEYALTIDGDHNTVNVKDSQQKIQTNSYAVSVLGTNNTYTVSGNSVLEAKYGAIYTNSDTATVIINGGTFTTANEDTEGSRLTPVIFAEKAKEININGGTITGQVGVVALNGAVNINGGTISGTNEDATRYNLYSKTSSVEPIKSFESDMDFYGAAVIADGGDTKVNITGGDFSAATEEAIVSVDDAAAYAVSGGIYDKPFDPVFVITGKVELTITNSEDQKWYVGQDALDALDEAKTDVENKINVLQGNLIIEDAAEGLTVINSGEGEVYVNAEEVPSGETVVAPKAPEKPAPENPDTSDYILSAVSVALLSISGIVTTLLLRKRTYNR